MQEVPNLTLRNLTHVGFSRKKVIRRRICYKYKAWLERKNKKGNNITFVCLDASLVIVQPNSLWLDSGSPIDIANSL